MPAVQCRSEDGAQEGEMPRRISRRRMGLLLQLRAVVLDRGVLQQGDCPQARKEAHRREGGRPVAAARRLPSGADRLLRAGAPAADGPGQEDGHQVDPKNDQRQAGDIHRLPHVRRRQVRQRALPSAAQGEGFLAGDGLRPDTLERELGGGTYGDDHHRRAQRRDGLHTGWLPGCGVTGQRRPIAHGAV